jgi:hypothetical protein
MRQENAMSPSLFRFCIYTTVGKSDLLSATNSLGEGELEESKPWKGGWRLLQEAQAAKQDMPILFSDGATDCSTLIYWAILQNISIDEGKKGTKGSKCTKYRFKGLQDLPRQHSTQSLCLKSTGKKIAPYFIRPYAICHTPDFLNA